MFMREFVMFLLRTGCLICIRNDGAVKRRNRKTAQHLIVLWITQLHGLTGAPAFRTPHCPVVATQSPEQGLKGKAVD